MVNGLVLVLNQGWIWQHLCMTIGIVQCKGISFIVTISIMLMSAFTKNDMILYNKSV